MRLEDVPAPYELIQRRKKTIADWLKANGSECFEEQKHLDEGSQERVYWNYGYLVALRDVIDLMERYGPLN